MNVSKILERAYFNTNSNPANFPENYGIDSLNEVYQEIFDEIVKKYKDYFWNYWTTDIQEGVTEYDIQRIETSIGSNIVPGIAIVGKVKIKVGNSYRILPELSDSQREFGYKGWQLKDNHIILNREPKEDVIDGIKVEGIQTINDLAENDDEDKIFPGHKELQKFVKVLQAGLEYKLWKGKQDFDKANYAETKYKEELMKMISRIGIRTDTTFYSELQYE